MATQYHVIASGSLQCNAVVLWDDRSHQAIVIDPTDDARPVLAWLERHHVRVEAILLTHAHFDHAADAERAMTTLGKKAKLHTLDHGLYHRIPEQAEIFGSKISARHLPIDTLADADEFMLGPSTTIRVLHTPGHTEGSVAFYVPTGPWVISGDTLFCGSIGRTDLPGGSFQALRESIVNKLYRLPDETIVVPGHGPTTTIGHEKRQNPFIRADQTSTDWL
jgi:glyoxylase-like metal-dependent hydrolase (beta-lactamase superfamily II)